ncbi:hypothetical protein GLOIN_2v1884393 [Rhizophagus clarus]|uniref:Uncharacterized protein n=1 Tax=Rhizophagus clarus TaxID=94130 RepID=A0A8H3QL41_9GLOM|nr:hypothetical protein GLOIN_2v1884393 [Rhizophagus clarus]
MEFDESGDEVSDGVGDENDNGAGVKNDDRTGDEMLPDERHDRTFRIKCCQTKSTTGLLELSVAGRKA